MTKVKFYEAINDDLLKFAVIISKANGKWVFCKHRECGENILDTTKRRGVCNEKEKNIYIDIRGYASCVRANVV